MFLTTLKSFTLILSGTVCGFFSSSPPGPINLLVADSVLGERKLHRKAFITGVILAELILAGFAFWGYHSFLSIPAFQRWAPLLGGIFVVGLGVAGLFSYSGRTQEGTDKPEEHSSREKSGDFLQGLFLCGSNPAFLIFWIYVMSALSYSGLSDGVTMKSLFLLIGIAIGNTIWFSLFIRLLHRGVDRMHGNFLALLRKGISLALILLGLSGIIMFL